MQEYDKTDKRIHWLSQVITKANRTFLPAKDDDSHTNLYFDSIANRLFGRWIDVPRGKIILSLNLQSDSFDWLDEKLSVLDRVTVYNRTMDQLEKAVSEYPASIQLNTEKFFSPLHFDIPDYAIDTLADKDLSPEGIKQWIYYRELANRACLNMMGYVQLESEIRIWPHHFDTGVYTMVTAHLGLGFGLAMNDGMVGQPYFYLSGYNEQNPISYENLEQLTKGSWKTGEQWNGAVFPLNSLEAFSEKEAGSMIRTFIKEATDWFL